MKVSITTLPLADLDVDLLLLPIAKEEAASTLATLAQVLGEELERAAGDVSGERDEEVVVYPSRARARRAALLGLGAAADVDSEVLRRVAATGAELAKKREVGTVGLHVPDTTLAADVEAQALVEGFLLGSYRFLRYKSDEDAPRPRRLVIHDDEGVARQGVERGRVVASAVMTARDLVNLSPNEKTPRLFARAIEASGKKYGYEVSVWDKALIEEEKMGGLLAVNQGSMEPPVFVELTWSPEQAVNEKPVMLVGKGVVFDTGGLSLKDTKGSMDMMKCDMAGAAAVVGVFEALARLQMPLHVVGLLPVTDNRPGENAYVPGDVIRMHSGTSVEVLNTDAEGRLLLADALSYARTYRPELVVDVATLTGSQVVALGAEAAALMTNAVDGVEERLDSMEAAGRRSGDRVHRLPMYPEYAKLLESDVADLKNVGGRAAGSITAAKFLEHFVDYPWMHLDIAGPAFLQEPKPYRPRGGTGFGVRLLVDFLRTYASPKRG